MRRIPRETWVLVADGASARLFRNLGGENGAVKLHQEEALVLDPAEGVMPSVLPADVPAREIDEASFARQLAHRLNQDALEGRYAHLVLAADPDIRKETWNGYSYQILLTPEAMIWGMSGALLLSFGIECLIRLIDWVVLGGRRLRQSRPIEDRDVRGL